MPGSQSSICLIDKMELSHRTDNSLKHDNSTAGFTHTSLHASHRAQPSTANAPDDGGGSKSEIFMSHCDLVFWQLKV